MKANNRRTTCYREAARLIRNYIEQVREKEQHAWLLGPHPADRLLPYYLLEQRPATEKASEPSNTDPAGTPANRLRDLHTRLEHCPAPEACESGPRPGASLETHPWYKILLPKRGQIVFYIRNKHQLMQTCPLIRALQHPVVLIYDGLFPDDTALPPGVTAAEFDFTPVEINRNRWLEKSFPDMFRAFDTVDCLLSLLRPEAVVVAEGYSCRERMWAIAGKSYDIPVIAVRQARKYLDHPLFDDCPYPYVLIKNKQSRNAGCPNQAEATPADCPEPAGPSGTPQTVPVSRIEEAARFIRRIPGSRYLANAESPRLHIGCGPHPIPGWLNTDIRYYPGVVYMNAGRPYPLPDASFRYVFSEHLFEHLPVQEGHVLLKECFRVLKPGGRIRLSMPDLDFLIRLYESPDTEIHRRYIRWSIENFSPDTARLCPGDTYPAMYLVNNFLRAWGHQMVYNRTEIGRLLTQHGFRDIVFRRPGQSEHPVYQGIERHGESIPVWANELETMVVEAVK